MNAILQASRERMRASHDQAGQIRAETDAQLAEVLTAEELAKLRAALPKRPR